MLPHDRQPHLFATLICLILSCCLDFFLSLWPSDALDTLLDDVCLSSVNGREEVEEGKKRRNIWEMKAKICSKSVSICICFGVFVCVTVSAVVLQVQSGCLSFFCSSPTSINRSLCALQFLRGFVLFSLFPPSSSIFPVFLLCSCSLPSLFVCLYVYQTVILVSSSIP